MTEKKQAGPYPIRPSAELRSRLEEAARASGRTLHSEIIARLEASFSAHSDLAQAAQQHPNLRQIIVEELENYITPDRIREIMEITAATMQKNRDGKK